MLNSGLYQLNRATDGAAMPTEPVQDFVGELTKDENRVWFSRLVKLRHGKATSGDLEWTTRLSFTIDELAQTEKTVAVGVIDKHVVTPCVFCSFGNLKTAKDRCRRRQKALDAFEDLQLKRISEDSKTRQSFYKKSSIRSVCGELRATGSRTHVLQPFAKPVKIGEHGQSLTPIPGWLKRSSGLV